MKKIEGAVFEQFRAMELGDWSTTRGGDWTFVANTSTANNNTCDEDGEYYIDGIGVY